MANELKLGGTYKHYKTRGLYTALQLVKFEGMHKLTDHVVCSVTFTGDGPCENLPVDLYLSFTPSLKLYLMLDDDVRFQPLKDAQQVLYFSPEHQRYFVRPLLEFVADVEHEQPVKAVTADGLKQVGLGYSSVPRFELQP